MGCVGAALSEAAWAAVPELCRGQHVSSAWRLVVLWLESSVHTRRRTVRTFGFCDTPLLPARTRPSVSHPAHTGALFSAFGRSGAASWLCSEV